ncbi:hypothetical protein P2G74_18725 [Cronobacter muytjensii]|nr:hypothetical protein [Cronobacter muytjensii]MEB8641988.1 hypothetical protein [Cronobacter muytjensii]
MSNEFNSNKLENCFELALENIIKHGDTDIFPIHLKVGYLKMIRRR